MNTDRQTQIAAKRRELYELEREERRLLAFIGYPKTAPRQREEAQLKLDGVATREQNIQTQIADLKAGRQ